MTEQKHPFELIKIWAELPDDEVSYILRNSEQMSQLISAIELLGMDPKDYKTQAKDNILKMIRALSALIKSYSWNLGEAIIKSDDLIKAGKAEDAISVMNGFIVSCDSSFYRESAESFKATIKKKF